MTTRTTKSTTTQRAKSETSTRRITKADNRFADYASLKATTGIVIPEVKKVMLDRKRAEAASGIRRGMYPSEMSAADWCPKATYFRMSGLPEPESRYSFSLENVFAQGNAIHDKWQNWLSQTGKLWGDWKCSRCSEYVKDSLKPDNTYSACIGTSYVKINGLTTGEQDFTHDWHYKEVTLKSTSLPISGHADGGLVQHNSLVELKSISPGSFRYNVPKMFEAHTYNVSGKKITDTEGLWKEFHSPLTSHLRQGNLYLFMAAEMNLPFDKISFVYENKANNQTKEFVVPYTYSIIESIIEKAHTVKDALDKGTPPNCVKPEGSCANCNVYKAAKADTKSA